MAVREMERNLEEARRGSDCSTGLAPVQGRGKEGGSVSDCNTALWKFPPG